MLLRKYHYKSRFDPYHDIPHYQPSIESNPTSIGRAHWPANLSMLNERNILPLTEAMDQAKPASPTLMLNKYNTNPTPAADNTFPKTSGTVLVEHPTVRVRPHLAPGGGQHASTRRAHPTRFPPSTSIHHRMLETYGISEFLNVSREDPWTPQFPRFQTQEKLDTSTKQQKSYPLLRFLSDYKGDPWTTEYSTSIITTQVREKGLSEVDRLFESGGFDLSSQY